MIPAVLFHNPKAGEKGLRRDKLLSLVEKEGFSCQYVSIKEKGWENFDEDVDILLVAGGDGTVRRVAEGLLHRKLIDRQFPIGIIPMGTANNLSKTLGIPQCVEEAIAALSSNVLRKVDAGFVEGLGEPKFFLEGMGAGIFPKLIKKMQKKEDSDAETIEEKLLEALEALEEITAKYEAFPVSMVIDGAKHEGEYLMVEIMNTRSIGPNLVLADNADPGDGELEVVLISETHRDKLLEHIRSGINGVGDDFAYSHLKAREVIISLPGTDIHVDDEIFKYAGGDISVYLKNGVLEMLVPE